MESTATDICRDKSGRFMAGQSGNAGGRPRDEVKVAELARSFDFLAR